MYRAFSDSCHLYIRIVLTLINFECNVLTDRNKRSEMLSLLLWSVNLFIQVYTLIFIKLSWIGFISDKFDTSSSNLISIITSLSFDVLARQNDVIITYITRSIVRASSCYRFLIKLSLASCNFITKWQIRFAKKAKRHGIIFSIIAPAGISPRRRNPEEAL